MAGSSGRDASAAPPDPGGAPPLPFLAAAALLGLLARLAFGFGYWIDQPLTRDESEYLSLARSLAAGAGFVYDEVMRSAPFVPFGRAPGYPAFLALVGGGSAVTQSVPASVKIAQAIVGALGVVLIGLTAHRLAGSRAARMAGLLGALYPPLVWIAGYALSEALFWPVGLAIVWGFDRVILSPRPYTPALACGLLCGAGVLIRPALLLFLPLAAGLLIVRGRPAPAAALTLGVLLVLLPWTARNYEHHGRPMLVASDGGVTFWTGNHPLATGEGDMAANPAIKLDNQRLRAVHPGLTEEEMEPIYYREALGWIRDHPIAWLALEAKKLFYLVVPIGPSYTLHSRLYYGASVVSYVSVLALALFAAATRRVAWSRTSGLWLLACSSVLVSLVFFPQERFRIPVLDPALIVLASARAARPRADREG